MKILSTWKNSKYPTKTAEIRQTEDGRLEVFIDYVVPLMPDAWIEYEKLLYSDGWRKVPKC